MSFSPPGKTTHDLSAEIRGVLQRITFHNQENGYTVARLQTDNDDKVTVTGTLAGVSVGSFLSLSGKWISDAKYGNQFQVFSYSILTPNTVHGIERYLGSGLIKGIGPKYAARIVARFGAKTMEILDRDPDRLLEIPGLGAGRIAQLKKSWLEHREISRIMVFLQGHGVSATYAVKIFKQYGQSALAVVENDPYRMAVDIWGIGFRTADDIARSLGVPTNDSRRLGAGILHLLGEALAEGHCFLPVDRVVSQVITLLADKDAECAHFTEDDVLARLEHLRESEHIIVDGRAMYLPRLYVAESGLAERLISLCRGTTPFSEKEVAQGVSWAEQRMGIDLAPEQRQAVHAAMQHKVMVITGGPGTGKSTILRGLLMIAQDKGLDVLLAAPTGRAAKRLAQACGHEARTIHRLLEYDPGKNGFQRNRNNPLECDFVIIDEASMLDTMLAEALVKAIPAKAVLLLVGDVDQLPSVGPGNVLRDVIESEKVVVARLSKIYRQGPGSLISVNAALINQGEALSLNEGSIEERDFFCIHRDDPQLILDEVLSLCQSRLAKTYGFSPINDIQILTPMRKGLLGTESLNTMLQETLNPVSGKVAGSGGDRFRPKDKVMQLRNNYDKEVFNGDIGLVCSVNHDEQLVVVNFDGHSVVYESGDLDELALAYACTIHKSQGSEFPCVILPLHTQHYPLLQRNLFYTGITRGKKMVIVVGSRKAITMAIHTCRVHKRHTRLKERLCGYSEQ